MLICTRHSSAIRQNKRPVVPTYTLIRNTSRYIHPSFSQTIMLAARGYGVDSIIAQAFVSQPDILRKELGIPDNLQIITGIGLGYQNPKSIINTYRGSRRSLQEVVTFKGI